MSMKLIMLLYVNCQQIFALYNIYEEGGGGSICNEISPDSVSQSFTFTHFIITCMKRSVSWLNTCKITVVQL